jgi:hypothetical protein
MLILPPRRTRIKPEKSNHEFKIQTISKSKIPAGV